MFHLDNFGTKLEIKWILITIFATKSYIDEENKVLFFGFDIFPSRCFGCGTVAQSPSGDEGEDCHRRTFWRRLCRELPSSDGLTSIGYRLLPGFEVGTRLGYSFNYVFDSYYGNHSIHHVAFGAYLNYEVLRGVYLHLEDEELCRLTFQGFASNPGKTYWYNSFFVGAGYRDYITDTSFAYISLLYNLRWDYGQVGELSSPYSSPVVIRVGYCIGL
jgi:hypothetical protein